MTEIICPNCGEDVLRVGFVIATTYYQCFARHGGKLFKSHSAKSRVEVARCQPCGAPLNVLPLALKEAAAA